MCVFFILLGIYLGVELPGTQGPLFLTSEGTANGVSKWLHHFTLCSATCEGSNFSRFLLKLLVCPCDYSHHSGMECILLTWFIPTYLFCPKKMPLPQGRPPQWCLPWLEQISLFFQSILWSFLSEYLSCFLNYTFIFMMSFYYVAPTLNSKLKEGRALLLYFEVPTLCFAHSK